MGYTTQSEQYGFGILIALVLAVLIVFACGCSQQGESTIVRDTAAARMAPTGQA